MDKTLKTLDLFAGIGGIRLGFEKEGFQTVFANDKDRYCKQTYDLNFPDVKLSLSDIQELDHSSLPAFDVLLGGFPCQPFSVAGNKAGFSDKERGSLFFHVMKIIQENKPAAIFLENVKHLVGHNGGRTYSIIRKSLENEGYWVKEQIMNSAEYGGIPQNRERVYIVAFKSQDAYHQFRFPGKIPLSRRVEEFLSAEVPDKYYYPKGTWLYEQIKAGDIVPEKGKVYQWRRIYLRESKSGLCCTLTANMGGGGHNVPLVRDNKGIRRLTPRECARLQGLGDNFVLPDDVSDTQLYKQIGNAVTVPVVRRIAARIMKSLRTRKNTQPESQKSVSVNSYGGRIQQEEAQRNHVSDSLREHAH